MPTRTYPVVSVDEGIRKTITNVEYLLRIARKLFNDCNDVRSSFVLYSYAVEEVGKAILLKQKKVEAINNNQSAVRDDITFTDHRRKIEVALEQLSTLARVPIYAQPIVSHFVELQEVGDFLNVKNRIGLLLVDFDENRQQWIDLPEPQGSSLNQALHALDNGLRQWRATSN